MSEQGPPPGARPGRPPAGRAPVKKRAAPVKKRPAGPPPPTGSAGTGEQQTFLGAALIGLAVILGLVLLVKGFTDEGGPVAADDPTVTESTVPSVDRDAAPTVPEETTTTTLAARDPASVSVLVANGSGVSGVAGQTADALEGAGYTIVDTANASPVSATQVLYVGEAEPDAAAIAAVLGLGPEAVAPMPDPPPVPDLAGADVVVIVGPDLASGPITTVTTAADAGAASTTTTTAATG